MFTKLTPSDEFEIMFNNYKSDNKLSMINFIDVLKYLKWRSDDEKYKLVYDTTLDIGYNYDNNNNIYRISITGNDMINKMLNLVHQRRNHIIFSIFITQFAKDEQFAFLHKSKETRNHIDIEQFDIRFRKSVEDKMTSKQMKSLENVPINDANKIFFRYKQRISLILVDDDVNKISIDLTVVKTAMNPNELFSASKSYELEIECMTKKPSNKIFDLLIDETNKIKQVLDGNDMLMSKDEGKNIIENYKKLMYGSISDTGTRLYAMAPISAEVQHVIDKIPNKYSVTDKADGKSCQLFIFNESIYLISSNLTPIKMKQTIKGYNNTIVEGELIHIAKKKKYLFLGFDCLFFNNTDMRNEVMLLNRLKCVNEVLSKLQNNKTYICKPYDDVFDMNKQEKHYTNEIEHFYENLNKMIDNASVNEYIFSPKLFIFPTGGANSEVFMYSYLIWYSCTQSSKVQCPYTLDGIIYTGIEQKYTKDKREHRYPIYKYKPPETNSIDFYVTFQRNPETNGYLEIYDNSLPVKLTNSTGTEQIFRVANFMVGDAVGNKEVPIPFMREENNHEALFPLERGEIRDVEGNFVQDGTVVEVIYTNNPNVPHQYRWSILRSRWDKTESVIREQKLYGNYKDTAVRIWKSMKEAVTIEEIKKLANLDTYVYQQKMLQSRINSSVISSDRAQDIYYQNNSNLIKIMSGFNNWLKSIIIYTYCQPYIFNNKTNKTRVLDIGCGRGGDLQKYYHPRVGEYVGTDPDHAGLFTATDSATSRYNTFKSKFPDFTKMVFIQLSGSLPFNSDIQSKKLPNMSQDNKNNIDKYFNSKTKFDIITSMFVIHYLFENDESVSNLIDNINNYLKIGGYIILTLFDANAIIKLLGDKDTYTSYYTNEDGQKTKLYEITKKYQGSLKDEPGQTIDVMMKWVSDTVYPENLISSTLMINTMERAGCRLVDSDLFSNVYNINKSWFSDVAPNESNQKNRKFYSDVAKFYGDLKGADKESKAFAFLNKYYVFEKYK